MFRYPKELKEKTGMRKYFSDEFTRSKDGKFRYLQKQRIRVYRKLLKVLEGFPVPVYLCMESRAVWKFAAGKLPVKTTELEFMFKGLRGVRNHCPEFLPEFYSRNPADQT